MKYLTIILFCISASASADIFFHPNVAAGQRVAITGVGTTNICYTVQGNVGPGATSYWECFDADLYGAREPLVVMMQADTQVRVEHGARWAYIEVGKNNWAAMSRYRE